MAFALSETSVSKIKLNIYGARGNSKPAGQGEAFG